MSLEEKVIQCIKFLSDKKLNNDLALFYYGNLWSAQACNPSIYVMLGETEGEFTGEGKTAEQAVDNLWLNIQLFKD